MRQNVTKGQELNRQVLILSAMYGEVVKNKKQQPSYGQVKSLSLTSSTRHSIFFYYKKAQWVNLSSVEHIL
jgi:hypothetical protein